MDLHQELDEKMNKIREVFDIEQILNLNIDQKYVQKYYQVNKLPYSFFHTRTGLIHMGISKGGSFKEEDLLGQAKIVEQYIKKVSAKRVLELATGRGGSSVYLAKKFPNVIFRGVDITKAQFDFSLKGKKVKNFHPALGDYHDFLLKAKTASYDIVFVIESLCHSPRKMMVLKQVCRILKTGGYFIVFDGYRKKSQKELSPSDGLALKFMEKGMAVTEFQVYDNFRALVSRTKLLIDSEVDASSLVLPTLERFERLAKLFFKPRLITKLLAKFFPQEFIYNAISGYLMPTLVKLNLAGYFITVLKKKQN